MSEPINAFQEAFEQDRQFKEACEQQMRHIEQAFGCSAAFEESRREIQKHFFDDLFAQLKAQP